MINFNGKFLFAAPPRTGSTWFLQAAFLSGLGEKQHTAAHMPHPWHASSLRVSLVRHPASWLRSYWTAIHRGSCGVSLVDRLMKLPTDGTFHTFVRAYTRQMPGLVSEIFSSYNADTYLRLEDMPYAAIEFFQSIGVPKDRSWACRELGKVNSSKYLVTWIPDLLEEFMECEQASMDAWEYTAGNFATQNIRVW